MTKKLFSIIAVAIIALGFASCTDNKEEQTMSITDDVVVTCMQTTTVGKIYMKMNITNSTIDITMPVQKGGSTVDATIKDLKLSFSNTLGYTFSTTNADAVDGSGKSLGVKINSLNGFLQMFNNPEIEQNIAITYNVDGKPAFVTRKKISHVTSSTVTDYGRGTFECKDATYIMTLNPEKGTANIEINNIQFIQQMPTLSEITIPGATLESTSTGYRITADEIVPTSADVPMDNRTITNLDITVNAGAGTFGGSFNCMGMSCTVTGSTSLSNE
ncbi:MAG: hypothetical protein ACI30V_00205 [Muribaculaceae bacterium]